MKVLEFLGKFFACFFQWRVKPSSLKEMERADIIVALSFGYLARMAGTNLFGRYEGPGKSNEVLADKALECLQCYQLRQLSVVCQWEIAECLPPLVVVHSIKEHRQPGKYLDTYEVLSQAWQFCQARGRWRAIIIAHPDQLWRAVMTAKKLGFEPRVPDVKEVPYDFSSAQPWTRSRGAFRRREILARLMYLLRGWI